jgi:hypothetical protein
MTQERCTPRPKTKWRQRPLYFPLHQGKNRVISMCEACSTSRRLRTPRLPKIRSKHLKYKEIRASLTTSSERSKRAQNRCKSLEWTQRPLENRCTKPEV